MQHLELPIVEASEIGVGRIPARVDDGAVQRLSVIFERRTQRHVGNHVMSRVHLFA